MEAEKQRLGFVEIRDGIAGAIAFAMQCRSQYRQAVLTSRKRGFTKPSFASLPEYRRGFIESYLAFKRYIETPDEQRLSDAEPTLIEGTAVHGVDKPWATKRRSSALSCATLFPFDPRLGPGEADPPDSLFTTGDEAEAGLAPKAEPS